MFIEDLKQLLAEDMAAVDQVIRTRLHSDVLLVNQVGEYIINGGGKRLRPALVVLSAEAFGYRGKQHHELAAVVEFIHTATLLHDDVVDESAKRRARPEAASADAWRRKNYRCGAYRMVVCPRVLSN